MPEIDATISLTGAVLDSLNIAVCLFDEEDRHVYWNEAFFRFFPEHRGHLKVGEPYADNLRRFYQARLPEHELPLIERYIEEGIARHRAQTQPFSFEHRGIWLRVASLPTANAGRLRIWRQFMPTASAAAEPDLSPEQRVAFMENFPDGIMLLDDQNRITTVNIAFLRLYELPARDLVVGRSFDEMLRENSARDQDTRWLALVGERQRFVGAPFELPLPSGRWIRVLENRGPDGLAYSIHSDITALKRQQEELLLAKQESDRANLAKSDFLAMMSHELRTPLNAILGFTEIIQGQLMGRDRGDLYAEYAGYAHDSGRILLSHIDDILDLSKAEAGKLHMVLVAVDVADLVATCRTLFETALNRHDVTLTTWQDPDITHIQADARALRQIVVNLVSNAIKFTPAGSAVNLTIARTVEGGFHIRVADHGIGMSAADLKIALEPFGQAAALPVSNPNNSSRTGTGLGLPLVKRLVELHRGEFTLSSTPGRGTTADVWLPNLEGVVLPAN